MKPLAVSVDRLARMVRSARCRQVVILLPLEASESWLQHLSGARWHACFAGPPDHSLVVAYLGARSEAFFAAMHDFGVVVRVCS